MKEHEGDEDFMREEINGDGTISDEFNKFLEKRVEAVEKEWILKFIKNISSVLNNILKCAIIKYLLGPSFQIVILDIFSLL